MTAEEPSVNKPTGGQGPLRRFRAVLKDYVKAPYTTFDGRTRERVVFDFIDLEVIEATEAYPFPTAQISIGYADPSQSRGETVWEAFSSSLRRLAPEQPLAFLKGKKQEWAMLPATVRRPAVEEDGTPVMGADGRQVWAAIQSEAWQIVEIAGLAAPEDLTDHIVALAEGVSEPQWYQALLADDKVRARPDIVESITGRTILPALIAAGRLVRSPEGILSKGA